MEKQNKDIDQLVALIYENTLGQSAWSEIGEPIANACGLNSPLIVHHSALGQSTRFLTNETAPTATAYDTYFASLDFVMQHVTDNECRQADFQASKILTAEELERNEFWMDFIRPLNTRDIFYSVLRPAEGHKFYLSFHASADQRTYPSREIGLRKTLAMHLSTALALSINAKGIVGKFNSLSYLFNDLDCPAAVLRPDGKVIEMNDGMRKLLGNGMNMQSHRLQCEDPREQHLLDELVNGLGKALLRDQRSFVSLSRTSGPPLHLRAVRTPLRSVFGPDSAFPNGVTLLLVATSEFPRLHSETNLQALGLRPGEARVANLVGGGMSPEVAAAVIGLKVSTARQYLKQAFDKLGVKRQSELTRLLLRLNIAGKSQ